MIERQTYSNTTDAQTASILLLSHVGMLKMLANENFADVTFVVGDTKVKAHKCILASRSNFFENMFNVGMREAQESVISV
jgi:hypothetical protein